MIDTKNIIKVFIHSVCWVLGFKFSYFVMIHSNSREIYGLIIGWWLACYIGYVANIRINATIPAFFIYLFVCFISYLLGYTWFYHDIANDFTINLIIIILFQGFAFISPIIVNYIVNRILSK